MKLLSPFVLGSHQLRNRVVFLPFYTAYAEKDGSVSPLMLAHYSRMAAAGPGLVVVEASAISPRAASIRCLYVNHSTLPGLKKLASAIKQKGSRAVLQLVHTGRFNPADPAGPSPVPVFGRQPVREMDAKELKGIANDFAQAALIAKEAGFDGAELHGAQGYLLASFLSPRTNLRNDEYGGTLEKRMAFPLQVAKAADPDVVDVIITSAAWDVKMKGAIPVNRNVYGYYVVKDAQGLMCVSRMWTEDYIGNGKYGKMRAGGVGVSSPFYIK